MRNNKAVKDGCHVLRRAIGVHPLVHIVRSLIVGYLGMNS